MGLKAEWVHYGNKVGYYAIPNRTQGPLPGLIVLQEIWGVDAHIQDVTRRFAQAGYAALAPDLYAKDGNRPAELEQARLTEAQAFMNSLPPGAWMDPKERDAALAQRPADEAKRIGECLGTLFAGLGAGGNRLDKYIPDLHAAAAFLRTDNPDTRGQKVASVGFCMGGGLAALHACNDPDLAAAVIFYGSAPPAEAIPNIRCPVLALHASGDKRLVDALPAFVEAMRQNGKTLEHKVYEGAVHAFFNDNRPSYNVNASRDAFVRTLDFLARAVG